MSQYNCLDCNLKSAAAEYLNEQEFSVLHENIVNVSFVKGETIIRQDTLSLNVAYLRTGMVKIHMRGPTHSQILQLEKAPTYLGLPTSFGDNINHFSVTAISDCTVCFIDLSVFRNLIFNNGRFSYQLIVELGRNGLFHFQRYASMSQKQIPGLVAETLLCFSKKLFENTSFTLPLTRGEIGDMIGTSRECVSRVLTQMCSDKIISVEKNVLTILKPEVLEQICEKG